MRSYAPSVGAEGARGHPAAAASPHLLRAVQIIRFGGPDVVDVVDIPEREARPRQRLYDVSTAGINYADTHHP
jgi:hypothetical protein